MKLSSEYIEGLKERTKRHYENEGLEWRGKIISLRCIDPSTGDFKALDFDFRDEVKEAKNASNES